MDIFRTLIHIKSQPHAIDYELPTILMGSCFSENIGNQLLHYNFNCLINPFGILYNPTSIKNSIISLIQKRTYTLNDLREKSGLFFSFDHHGRFSGTDPELCLATMNNSIQKAHQVLKEASFLLLTFGTAYVYSLKGSNNVVVNCHKVSQNAFNRTMLDAATIVSDFKSVIHDLREINPQIKIVFTVSPIRHLRDGAEENSYSKAILITAIHELLQHVQGTYYFPAYEIMMDELRDYRFYNDDMVHPSPLAIKYIWEKFSQSFFTKQALQLMAEIEKIKLAMQHKPFNPTTPEHIKFRKTFFEKTRQLAKTFPKIDFNKEIQFFS